MWQHCFVKYIKKIKIHPPPHLHLKNLKALQESNKTQRTQEEWSNEQKKSIFFRAAVAFQFYVCYVEREKKKNINFVKQKNDEDEEKKKITLKSDWLCARLLLDIRWMVKYEEYVCAPHCMPCIIQPTSINNPNKTQTKKNGNDGNTKNK